MVSKTFKWSQPSGKEWTIETNTDKGYIKTTDENGVVIQEQYDLTEDAINFMIENFISIITGEEKKKKDEYNPMYA